MVANVKVFFCTSYWTCHGKIHVVSVDYQVSSSLKEWAGNRIYWNHYNHQQTTFSSNTFLNQLLCLVFADKSYDYVLEPAPVSLPLVNPQETRVLQVSCGRAHSLVLTDAEGGQQTLLCFIVIVIQGLLKMNKVVLIGAQILYKVNSFPIKWNPCGLMWWVLHVSLSLSLVFSMGNNAYGQCGRKIVEDEVYRFVLQQY